MSAFEALRYEKRSQIAFITIARPKVLNALNSQSVQELGRAVQAVRPDNRYGCREPLAPEEAACS